MATEKTEDESSFMYAHMKHNITVKAHLQLLSYILLWFFSVYLLYFSCFSPPTSKCPATCHYKAGRLSEMFP